KPRNRSAPALRTQPHASRRTEFVLEVHRGHSAGLDLEQYTEDCRRARRRAATTRWLAEASANVRRPAASISDRSKNNVRGAESALLRLARGGAIASAVIGRAQIGAALDHAARRLAAREQDVLRFGSARIDGLLARVARPVPIARPLPHVA